MGGSDGGTPLGKCVVAGGGAALDRTERNHVTCCKRREVSNAALALHNKGKRSIRRSVLRVETIGVRTTPSLCCDVGLRIWHVDVGWVSLGQERLRRCERSHGRRRSWKPREIRLDVTAGVIDGLEQPTAGLEYVLWKVHEEGDILSA